MTAWIITHDKVADDRDIQYVLEVQLKEESEAV